MKNKVSLWIGNFSSANDLEDYLSLIYSPHYDFPLSKFKNDFGIDYYDDDFQEAYRNDQIVYCTTLIQPISYASTFIHQISNLKKSGNTIIAIYNFSYNGNIKKSDNVIFLGVFDYSF